MKQLVICMMAMLFGANAAMAQGFPGNPDGPVHERVEAQRVAFITQKLELTPEESAAFWPVYNEFRDAQMKLRQSARPGKMPGKMTEEEANAFIEAQLDLEVELNTLKREYYARLIRIVGPQKLAQLAPAEFAFNREVLNKLRERMGHRR